MTIRHLEIARNPFWVPRLLPILGISWLNFLIVLRRNIQPVGYRSYCLCERKNKKAKWACEPGSVVDDHLSTASVATGL